jgi:hypothetical protein
LIGSRSSTCRAMCCVSFLDHLEQSRRCSIRTRNQRFAAIHAMARFIAERSPEHIAWCGQIRSVPFKRFHRNELSYLDKPEMDALLAAPDRRTRQGMRDHALLLFLYNSGARVTEAASLQVGDLNLRAQPDRRRATKGQGQQDTSVSTLAGHRRPRCSLLSATARPTTCLPQPSRPSDYRHGIHWMLRNHVRVASASHPSLLDRGRSARTPSDIRQPRTCFAPESTSTPSEPGSAMSPSIQPTSMQRSTCSGRQKCSLIRTLSAPRHYKQAVERRSMSDVVPALPVTLLCCTPPHVVQHSRTSQDWGRNSADLW